MGARVECGWVEVPESRAAASSRTIELPFLRYFGGAEGAALDAVVYLEGGPGGSGIDAVTEGFDRFAPLLAERDLVVFDQRGTGRSRPALECREFDRLAGDADLEAVHAALAACRDRHTGDGVDLASYDTVENAADVDAVRAALGYERWDLYGISYGTRLALTVMRDHPAGVRSAVIDSVLPLEIDFVVDTARNGEGAFQRVFAACQAEPACLSAYPDPMGMLTAVLDELSIDPRLEQLNDGTQYLVTPELVLNVLFLLLYDRETIRYVPGTISMLANGDFTIIDNVVELLSSEGLVTAGMYLSVICADEVPFTSREQLAATGAALSPHFREFFADETIFDDCSIWNVAPSPASENQPVVSDIPTLVISGSFDPITPTPYAVQVANALTNARHYELVGDAHGASLGSCGSTLVRSFLADPSAPPDDGCVATLGVSPFEASRSPRVSSFAIEPPTPEAIELILTRAREAARRRRPH